MKQIKAIALDVDGVLTDGTFGWDAEGSEVKRFSFLDVMGISLGRKAGLIFALVSGEDSPLVDRYAQKMGIADVFKGCKDKGAAVREFAQRRELQLRQICFMGDDVNDLPAFAVVGLSAAPATAHEKVRSQASLVMRHEGGRGAVRELIDLWLAERESEPG